VPSDAFEELFDREKLLGGLPAKRANTLLFLIESRTARLTAQSRQAMQRFASRDAAQQRELAFIEAFALGREPPLRPAIQDLERHAPRWATLVARNPRVQAALAQRMSEKHRFARGQVPGIRAALGLDDPRVAAAFQQLYERPLDGIYVERQSLRERVRWARASLADRFEGLSPFWTAYALTLTETVGSTIVALPIAVAAIGPMPAVAVLVALGIVNVLTVAFMADALTRSATMRYGNAYIGRVVGELLGRPGAIVLSVGLVGICLMGMQADYIGVSSMLADATSVPAIGWVALLFVVELFYLRRGSIDATVTSALVVGAVNVLLILAICALAFVEVDASKLTYTELPFTGGDGFDRSSLALAFGVTFTAYFGHLSVSNCARVVLGRDPSGRALVRGVIGAQLTAIALYVLFVVAVTGAVAPSDLADEAGTALSPLADEAGAGVLVLGGALVVLGMGMASIHSALALFYLVGERLPSQAPLTLVLPRRGARVVLEGGRRGERTRVAMTYLGLARGTPAFRLDVDEGGRTRHVEGGARAEWNPFAEEPLRDLGERGLQLSVAVIDAGDHEVRAQLTTSMRLRYEGEWDTGGVSLAGVLALADAEAEVVAWLLRRPDGSVAEVAELTGLDPQAAAAMLAGLAEQGLVAERHRGGERRYVARAGRRRGGRLSAELWEALSAEEDAASESSEGLGSGPRSARGAREGATGAGGGAPGPAPRLGARTALGHRVQSVLRSERGRFLAGVSPVVAIFAFAAWQATSGAISLADVLSFLGVIIVALLAAIFPVLLVVAARNSGELAGWGYELPAGLWVLGIVYTVGLGGVTLHGLVLWEDPLQRAAALAVAVLIVVLTVSMVRGGTFTRRATIELRHDEAEDGAHFALVAAGRPVIADVVLEYDDGERRLRASAGEIPSFSALRRASFTPDWGGQAAPELKVWAHRVTAEEESLALDAHVEVAGTTVAIALRD
jgi:DNA-binding MarR family transcriptional regulator